jgi:hypothetical protein
LYRGFGLNLSTLDVLMVPSNEASNEILGEALDEF